MGAKSLGEQMGVKENDAACYIDSFKSRYTGTEASVTDCLVDIVLFNASYTTKCFNFKNFVREFPIKISTIWKFSPGIVKGREH